MTDLGTLGGSLSIAVGVSADGNVIVGRSEAATTEGGAFKYAGSIMTYLGTLGGTSSIAHAVSADGSVIVGYSIITGYPDSAGNIVGHAFKYTGSTMSDLGTLGGINSAAFGVSADGSVIVGLSYTVGNSEYHAFKYASSTMTDLGTLGGSYSYATGVSADGSVIVGYSNTVGNSEFRAFKYTGSVMSDLGTLGGKNSYAYGVSANGSVIVGSSDTAAGGDEHAFKYSGGAMTDLGTLGGAYSRAYAVSADGSVIVGESSPTALRAVVHAFAYRNVLTPTPPIPPAPKLIDLPNTYADFFRSANNIRNTIALRTSSMALMMDYDCRAFGQHNTCISFGGRYGDLNASANEGAGILTLAYRLSPSVRIGAFIDHRVTQSKPAGINYSDDTPSVGAFVAYDDRGNGTGAQGKLTAVYNTGKVGVTRLASSGNTEAGSGRSSLTSYAVGAELGWGFKVNEGWVATPYAGLKHTSSKLGSYAESQTASVEFPISYADYGQRLTTATAGARIDGRMTERVSLALAAGVERDLRSTMDAYAGTSDIPGLTSFSLSTNANSNRNRMTGTAALSYQIAAHQRVTAGMNVRENAFVTQPTRTAQMTYEMAF